MLTFAQFQWIDKCRVAFEQLRMLFTLPPVLAYSDFTKPFVLHTDASGEVFNAVVVQEQEGGKNHPISYASCTLSKHERGYNITVLEALGVVWPIKHYRAYLWDHQCTVYRLCTC